MNAPLENRPETVSAEEADRIANELLAKIKAEAEAINFGGLVEIDQAIAEWMILPAPDSASLTVQAAVTIYDETGDAQCLNAHGHANLPNKEGGKWFLSWTLAKRGSCLA